MIANQNLGRSDLLYGSKSPAKRVSTGIFKPMLVNIFLGLLADSLGAHGGLSRVHRLQVEKPRSTLTAFVSQ